MQKSKTFGFVRNVQIGTKIFDYEEIDINFSYKFSDGKDKNSCEIKIYNISDDTKEKIRAENGVVKVSAGYKHSHGEVFFGTVRKFQMQMDGNDRYAELRCLEGKEDWSRSAKYGAKVVNKTYVKNTTFYTIAERVCDYAGYKLSKGSRDSLSRSDGSDKEYFRAKTFSRVTPRRVLEQLAIDSKSNLYIVGDTVFFTKEKLSTNDSSLYKVNQFTFDAKDGSIFDIPKRKELKEKKKGKNKSGKDRFIIKVAFTFDIKAGNRVIINNSEFIDGNTQYVVRSGEHVASDSEMYTQLEIERV